MEPSLATVKRLLALSGNRCAFPSCPQPLADPAGNTFVGEICHIRAASPKGKRYDTNQTEEDRHAFENLVLMCSLHHTIIDQDDASYTVDRLLEIKRHHEQSAGPGPALPDAAIEVSISSSMIGQVAHTIMNTVNAGSAPPQAYELSGLERQREVGLQAWVLLQKAVGTAADLASIAQWRPDFRFGLRDDDDARRYLAEAYQFSEEQIETVLVSRDPNERSRSFARIEDVRRYRVADGEHRTFHNYVIENGPMLPQSVFDAFVEASKSLRSALITLRIALENPHVGDVEGERHRASEKISALANVEVRDLRRIFRAGLGIPEPGPRR